MAESRIAKPFLKWAGGKTQLINNISQVLPKNIASKNYTYIEPFVGSGAILFWILNEFPNIQKAVINDINADLIKVYKTIATKPKELISILEILQNEFHGLEGFEDKKKEYYYRKRDLYNSRKEEQSGQAALFIFLNRTCFNGLYRVNRKNKYNVPMGGYKNPTICNTENILAVNKILQKVEILSDDFEQTIDYSEEDTLFYLDPPYKPLSQTSSFNSYAKDEFNDDEQIRLRDFCTKIDALGHHWILSNSDVKGKNPNDDFFDNLYSGFHIERVDAKRSINVNPNKRGKLKELLITNTKPREYIPTSEFNRKLFIQNFDKPYWEVKCKLPIDKIKFDKERLDFQNEISEVMVDNVVKHFDLDFWVPITIDKEYYLLDGQHRLKAAKRLNLKYIDVAMQNTELLKGNK